jgi:hypothetical protein
MPNFGVCGDNASQPTYSFSYDPISTSTPLNDSTGAAGIITDAYAPESTEVSMSSALVTATDISFEPLSTTYTAVESTWAAVSYADASVTTVTVLKKIDC